MKNFDTMQLPERILLGAFATFAERGYDKASMDEVAAVAKTTKRTVYAHFENKEKLFRAAIAGAVERFLSELPKLDQAGTPEQELLKFVSMFSELSTWRRAVLLQRVVIAESQRLPDLGNMLHRDVILAAETRIADYLATQFVITPSAQVPAGKEGFQFMARMFLNMATGPQRFATLMEARQPAPEHPFVARSGVDDDWLRLSVRIFLRGLTPVTTALD